MDSHYIYILLSFVLSMVCGLVFIPQIIRYCKRKNLFDLPDKRKVHKNAIPRLGGVCFMPSMIVTGLVALLVYDGVTGDQHVTLSLWSCLFFISLLLIYAVGIIDDLIGLDATTKFFVQIVAATLMPLSGLYINNLYGFLGFHEIPAYVGMPLTVFIIVFIDNAINLIDGIDGLAGGLALMGLSGFLASFISEGIWTYAVLIAGLMGVLVAFLYFNMQGDPKKDRKIFMGDSGSLTLGFILGFLFIKLAMDKPDIIPYSSHRLLLSFTFLVVPVLDVVRVVFTRIIHRRPLFDADKNHIHHKLLRSGMNQHATLASILTLAMTFTAFNLIMALIFDIGLTWIVLFDCLLYVAFNYLLNVYIRRQNKKPFV